MGSRLFAACTLVSTSLFLWCGLDGLDLRPMHGDEANQAVKAGLLLETGRYEYDPRDHHGPSLYWLTLPVLRLRGVSDLAHASEADFRVLPVLFGAGLIVLLLLVGDGMGRWGAVLAGALIIISPGMNFYSRYYIQEVLLVLFTFAAIGCAWRYLDARWHGRTSAIAWAIAAGACFGMMYATKETWILAAAAMVAALGLTAVWTRWRDGRWTKVRPYLRPVPLVAGAAAACLVAIVLFSSFGTDWSGPWKSVSAYWNYVHRGTGGEHAHPWYFYLQLLVAWRPARGFFWSEGLIVGLAAVGFAAALVRRVQSIRHTPCAAGNAGNGTRSVPDTLSSPHPDPLPEGDVLFCRFLAFYTLVLTVLYSAIPYKTPWCMLSFFHGMVLLAGVGAWAICGVGVLPASGVQPRRLHHKVVRLAIAGAIIAAMFQLQEQNFALNFRFYADPRNPYVYAHTATDVLKLAAAMERLAEVSPEHHDMLIHVVTPDDYWPLPWYLRTFNAQRVGYWNDASQWAGDAHGVPAPAVIILTPDVQDQIDGRLRTAYNKQMLYRLRPEVFVLVYVRADLWAAYLESAAGR